MTAIITDDDMPSPDDVKIENLNQLVMAASRFNNIRSFIDYTETFQDEAVSDNRDGVRLMTVHRSKGLEFPVVFLVGMVENILPSKKGQPGGGAANLLRGHLSGNETALPLALPDLPRNSCQAVNLSR